MELGRMGSFLGTFQIAAKRKRCRISTFNRDGMGTVRGESGVQRQGGTASFEGLSR